ncbi:MAG: DUF2306 domain-containing protein [Bacteroidota bacterium]
MLIPTHTLFGIVALASGAGVLLRRKGDRVHRAMGGVYAVSMLLLCVGSFWIQDSTPFYEGFGPFHVAAIVSLVTLLWGLWSVRWAQAPPEARAAGHVRSMVWSYVGLVMATGSHLIEPTGALLGYWARMEPGFAYPLAVALCWGLPPLVAVRMLRSRGERLETRFATITSRSTHAEGHPPPNRGPGQAPASGEGAAEAS